MMVERALELRQQSPQVPILSIGAPEDSHPYMTSDVNGRASSNASPLTRTTPPLDWLRSSRAEAPRA